MNSTAFQHAYRSAFFADKRLWEFLLIALCVIIYIKNYWLAEDAYINFRSLDQLWAGRGPVWNVGERVQVYTSAFWYWLIAASRYLINDLYWNVFSCSLLLYLLTIGKILRSQQGGILITATVVLCLLSSNSFMDFAASGLENVLIYFLLTFFFFQFFSQKQPTESSGVYVYLWCNLLLLARHDTLILILPFMIWYFWTNMLKKGLSKELRAVLIGMSPFIGWTTFSLIYYGFPFPNTAYAKLSTGIPKSELFAQGMQYWKISSLYDHLMPILIVVGTVVGLKYKATRLLACGVLLNVLYIFYVGGDYMRGRFFSHLYLISTLMLFFAVAQWKYSWRLGVTAVVGISCVVWNFYATFTPITTPLNFIDHVKINETANERGIFYRSTSIPAKITGQTTGRPFPDWPFFTEGLALRDSSKPWVYITNIGMSGYAAGLDLHIFDRLALADPLMARLPTLPGPWAPGHFVREMPWGYVEANLDGVSRIYDPDLDKYYQTLRIITRSADLFTLKRFTAIWQANLSNHYKHLRDSHIERWSQRGCKICKGENIPSP